MAPAQASFSVEAQATQAQATQAQEHRTSSALLPHLLQQVCQQGQRLGAHQLVGVADAAGQAGHMGVNLQGCGGRVFVGGRGNGKQAEHRNKGKLATKGDAKHIDLNNRVM